MVEIIPGCLGCLCLTALFITFGIIDYKREKYGLVERAYAFRKKRKEDKEREKADKICSI